ncbi:hypothetical protein BJX65DRAFT_312293 [Aspergillus insuetus]
MTLSNFLLYACFQLELVATTLCLSDIHSPTRSTYISLIFYTSGGLMYNLDFLGDNEPIYRTICAWIAVYCLHHLNLLWFSAIDIRHITQDILRTSQEAQVPVPLTDCFLRAFYLCITPRGIGTTYEVTPLRRSPEPRTRFLLRNIAIVLFKYIKVYLLISLALPLVPTGRLRTGGRNDLVLGAGQHTEVARASFQASAINLGVVLFSYCSNEVLFMDFYYPVVAILCVGLRLSRPDQWPPLFGSIAEAYTLRRFWR